MFDFALMLFIIPSWLHEDASDIYYSRVKGREFGQYYESFRTELLPEIGEGFSTPGLPHRSSVFNFLLAVSIFV